MSKILKISFSWAFAVTTVVFTFIPENAFGKWPFLIDISKGIAKEWVFCPFSSHEWEVIFGRLLFFLAALLVCTVLSSLRFGLPVSVKGKNYCIKIMYGDLLKQKGLKVIPFDECFTTKVGTAPEEIKPTSICGQYLIRYPIDNIQILIDEVGLKSERKRSEYQNQTRYKSGMLIPRDNFLLMAFARLNGEGLGVFASCEEYLHSLEILWRELNKYYNQQDIYIPVLGSGLTRIGDTTPTQQELVDMMICSYKLSPYKIKSKLRIVCRKCEDFSLKRIGDSILLGDEF